MAPEKSLEIHFPSRFDDGYATDVIDRGWLDGVEVQLPSGKSVTVTLFEPSRLVQSFEAAVNAGMPFIGEKNLILVPSITPEAIKIAVTELFKFGFFDNSDYK